MTLKLTLEDFMQYTYAEFTFEPGINILNGLTGAGKSTIIWALYGVLCNPSGFVSAIRNGQKQCRVTLENNGNKLTWIKTTNSSTYIDCRGEEYIKASKLDSRDFGNFGFYFDSKDRVMNIHDQWCVLFPFGESDTDMFRLFEDIFNISCSVPVIEEIRKDEMQCKVDMDTHKTSIAKDTELIKNCDELIRQIDETKLDEHIEQYSLKQQYYENINTDYNKYCNYNKFINVQLPESFDVSALYNSKDTLDKLNLDFDIYVKNCQRCNWQLPELDLSCIQIDDISQICNDYNYYIQQLQNIRNHEMLLHQNDILLQQAKTKLSQIRVCPTCGSPLNRKENSNEN